MKKFLVTGGAGFIGANFVLGELAKEAVGIVNLDKLTYAGTLLSLEPVMEHPNHRFVEGDICDGALVSRLLDEEQPDALIHFAAESHVDRSIDGPAPFIQTNVVGTFTLLEAVRAYLTDAPGDRGKDFRFIHVSTDEVFGSLGAEGQFHEDTPYAPNSPYSASKAASDHLVRAYYHTYGIPAIITNCSNNYGPHQFPEKLIPLMILNALEGKPLPVYGDGGHIRDWLYVLDHCKAIARVVEKGIPGETYSIGGQTEKTNLDVVKTLCEILDRLFPDAHHAPHKNLIAFVEDRPGHDRRYAIDTTKIQRDLGWAPEESFETGLEKTVAWYLEHRGWCQQVTSGGYQRTRLGLSK